MSKFNIVLMGTSDFAVPALDCLVSSGHNIVSVVCQPDRPNQRGKKIKYNALKIRALNLQIPVYQPEKIRSSEAVDILKGFNADIFVVAAYGQILSKEVLDIPSMGCINIHGSLLPEYRGAAPIHHAIIDGKTETGVTIMQMNEGMDTGNMIKKGTIQINDYSTVGQLHDDLAQLGGKLLIEVLEDLSNGRMTSEQQDHSKATYADKVDKNTGKIDWDESTFRIIRRINGTDPFPGAWTMINGVIMKCFEPERCEFGGDVEMTSGTIIFADTKNGLVIKTGDGACIIGSIQMPGKKRMLAKEYFRGNVIDIGTICE